MPPVKPHLRLHYNGRFPNGGFPWSVEYLRGPSQRARRETFQHTTSQGALHSAVVLWF